MNLYGSRGGTPEEFMQALYAVSRDLNLNAGLSGSFSDVGSSSQSSTGSKGSGSRDSGSRHSRGSGNRFGGIWGYRPWGQVNNDSDSGILIFFVSLNCSKALLFHFCVLLQILCLLMQRRVQGNAPIQV